MKAHQLTWIGLALIAMVACSKPQPPDPPLLADEPQNAVGDTPVKYVSCDSIGHGCFVVARFRDYPSCEEHKRFDIMLCDSVSQPNVVTCRPSPADSPAMTFCAN